jgi:hypothetical protein
MPTAPKGIGRRSAYMLDVPTLARIETMKTFYASLGLSHTASFVVRRAVAHLAAHVESIKENGRAEVLVMEQALAGTFVRMKAGEP